MSDNVEQILEEVKNECSATKRELLSAADYLDRVWKRCRIVQATSRGLSIAGGVTAVVGGALTIATVGAASPILIAGLAVKGVGTATSVGTTVVEKFKNSKELPMADKQLEKLNSKITVFLEVVKKWCNEAKNNLIDRAVSVAEKRLGKTHFITKILISAANLAKSIVEKVVKFGPQVLGVATVGFSAVNIVFESVQLGFTIRDLAQERGSDASKVLREKALEL